MRKKFQHSISFSILHACRLLGSASMAATAAEGGGAQAAPLPGAGGRSFTCRRLSSQNAAGENHGAFHAIHVQHSSNTFKRPHRFLMAE